MKVINNLLKTTEDTFLAIGKTWNDVESIICDCVFPTTIDIDDFKKYAKLITYEGDFAFDVNPFLLIKFNDDSWLERGEDDEYGYAWWDYMQTPVTPTEKKEFHISMLRR